MQNELINEGLTLMLAGMGTVFMFLTVLVIMMALMSRLILRLQSSADAHGPNDDEVAAITAALARHRQK
ncbi:MAG: OadG family transporter subunit [Gammaproteobacteria bacterium]|nr:OadG family transporter subunit [Gammaproteobacteria bacterium]MDH3373516.1 OadG family transporter subunit [Gammaproteobacteria bacterium]MDH3409225.1 OadG family transporter subunit [Gammaproteobacteria bacterium]MDH3551940.1 OadG family transporter subunit [Gammaproteobacteria bacterium]